MIGLAAGVPAATRNENEEHEGANEHSHQAHSPDSTEPSRTLLAMALVIVVSPIVTAAGAAGVAEIVVNPSIVGRI